MKCEDAANELIAYAGGRADSARRRELEKHAAGCAACRTRLEEFRALSSVLDELPAVEPSFGFDARVRARVAAEPQRGWFGRLVPQPRLALSAAMLVLLAVWVVRMEPYRTGAPFQAGTNGPATQAAVQQEDFNAIKDLGVLENYDVLTQFDALAETPAAAPQTGTAEQGGGTAND